MKPVPARKAASFVCSVWSKAGGEGYGSIQTKNGTRMSQGFFKLPAFIDEIAQFLEEVKPGVDIYFCPLPSNKKSRKKESFSKSKILWADLDESSPYTCHPKPTIAWETSPNRYQALWFLDRELTASEVETANKNLTYSIGADKGGWDLGQILRIPYTTNYKPQYDHPRVKLLWHQKRLVNFKEVAKLSKKYEAQPKLHSLIGPPVEISKTLAEQWFNWEDIPEGQRSEKPHAWVWSLLEHGLSPEWVLRAVSEHPLTVKKWGNRAEQEVQRSIDKWDEVKPTRHVTEWSAPEVLSAIDFLGVQHEVRWMIKDIWMEDTVGFIDGPPKVFKTWVALDLALSIASGTPFMGNAGFRWQESQAGMVNVLIVQEEDPRVTVARRLGRILEAKGFDAGGYRKSSARINGSTITLKTGQPIPLYIVTSSGFTFAEKEYVDWLEETIANMSPRFVLLDPLLTMLGDTDEFKGGEVANLLRPLKLMRDKYGCSFCIVHHTYKLPAKADSRRPGEQLYGSMAFHAWLESALHIRPVGDVAETRLIEIKREFKAAPSGDTINVFFPPMDTGYSPEIKTSAEVRESTTEKRRAEKESVREGKLQDDIARVFTLVQKSQPVSGQEIEEELEWGKEKRMRIIKAAVEAGVIVYDGKTTGRSAKLIIAG